MRVRVWQTVLCVVVIALVLLAAPAAYWFITTSAARGRVNEELKRIAAAGEPVTTADLEKLYPRPPKDQDTTALWLEVLAGLEESSFAQAGEKLPVVGTDEQKIPPPSKPWPELAQAEQFLQRYRRLVDLMHQASARGGQARYPIDFSKGMEILLPHAQNLRMAVRLLILNAHVGAHRHDPALVAQSLRAGFAAARSLEREPILVSQLVRLAMDMTTVEAMSALMPEVSFTDSQLALLQGDLRRAISNLRSSLLCERVIMREGLRNPRTLGITGLNEKVSWLTRAADLEFFLVLMRKQVSASNQDTPQMLRSLEKISRDNQMELTKHPMTMALMPAVVAAATANARHQAMLAAADAGIGVERFRRANGKLPARLADLVPKYLPKVPIDPFDGKPLRYVARKNRYTTYSVGKDLKDDRGTENPDGANEPDVTFTVRFRQLAK